MRWSELSRARRALALGKIGTTTRFLLLDLRDAARTDPALREELRRCKTDEDREQLAFEYFGDEGQPQPTKRSSWLGDRESPGAISGGPTFRTPDWPGGRLPPLGRAEHRETRRPRGAKELGIPERELWWIIERRLELGEKASRAWLSLQTKKRHELEYVPRPRLSPLVDWIDAHPERARHLLSLREIPSEFRAGKLGRIPPSV